MPLKKDRTHQGAIIKRTLGGGGALEAIPLDAELKVGSLLHRMPVNHRSNTQGHQRDCGGKNKKNDDDILLINHLI